MCCYLLSLLPFPAKKLLPQPGCGERPGKLLWRRDSYAEPRRMHMGVCRRSSQRSQESSMAKGTETRKLAFKELREAPPYWTKEQFSGGGTGQRGQGRSQITSECGILLRILFSKTGSYWRSANMIKFAMGKEYSDHAFEGGWTCSSDIAVV